MDQPEQGHQPGPGHLPVEQYVRAALVPSGFVQEFVKRPHAVGLGVDGIVDRQQLPRLGKQADHQPHHDPHRRLEQCFMGLGVGQPALGPRRHQRGEQIGLGAMGRGHVFQQQFHRLPDVLPQHAGKIGLPFAGLLDGIEQGRYAALGRRERLGRKKLPQAIEFLGAVAAVEPAVALPLAP